MEPHYDGKIKADRPWPTGICTMDQVCKSKKKNIFFTTVSLGDLERMIFFSNHVKSIFFTLVFWGEKFKKNHARYWGKKIKDFIFT